MINIKSLILEGKQKFVNWLLRDVHVEQLTCGTSTVFINDLINITGNPVPTNLGQIGMNSSGRPLIYVSGASHAVSHVDDVMSITSASLPLVDSEGLGSSMIIRKSFSAGVGGSADDVVIYNSNAPFNFRIIESYVYVSATALLGALTLRSTTGGGGSALSDAFGATATGLKYNTVLSSTSTVSQNGTLVLRRSNNTISGEVIIIIQKI